MADRHRRLRRPPKNPVAGFTSTWRLDPIDSVVGEQEARLADQWGRGWQEGELFIGRWEELWS